VLLRRASKITIESGRTLPTCIQGSGCFLYRSSVSALLHTPDTPASPRFAYFVEHARSRRARPRPEDDI
jgi:hypothetical protein